MPQLVFEVYSKEVAPVATAIVRVLEGYPTDNSAATTWLEYEPTPHGLDWAATQFGCGNLVSFVLHPRQGAIRYALLTGPMSDDASLFGYIGTIEYTRRDYDQIWAKILDVDGLQLVCLGFEEGVEFKAHQVTPEAFPWNDGCLVVGAVRTQGGSWHVKRGPSFFPAEQN